MVTAQTFSNPFITDIMQNNSSLDYAVEPLGDDFAFILFDRLVSNQTPIGVYYWYDLVTDTLPELVRSIFTIPGVYKVTIAENVIGIESYHDDNEITLWNLIALRIAARVSWQQTDHPLIRRVSSQEFRARYPYCAELKTPD